MTAVLRNNPKQQTLNTDAVPETSDLAAAPCTAALNATLSVRAPKEKDDVAMQQPQTLNPTPKKKRSIFLQSEAAVFPGPYIHELLLIW